MENLKTIMVVDDDSDCRVMVKAILENSGYAAVDCSGGADFFEKLKKTKPDLVVLDIMMPEMTGYEVATILKQQADTQEIPIIMLTAKGEPEDLIAGYKDYSVEYYITKPFTARQLLSGIELILG